MMLTAACTAAIREEMELDDRVFIMGEDIREAVFRQTAGLLERFGPERVHTLRSARRQWSVRAQGPRRQA